MVGVSWGRPGYEKPGNVITGMLAGFDPETITPRAASEPTGELRNGSNAVPSYMAGCVNGKCGGTGSIRSERVLTHAVNSPFFTGPLRSPLRLQNTFAHEGFMDEISAYVKADPVAYRLQHLKETRVIDVVKAAAKAASWDARPSPKRGTARTGTVIGRGIACVAYEGDNGYAALVAEVEVDQESGQVQARRFVVALDCGPISNPDGLRNQIEGGVSAGNEPSTWGRNHMGRSQGDFDRLAELHHPAAWNPSANHRERSYRPADSRGDWRGRDGDHARCRCNRQCDF